MLFTLARADEARCCCSSLPPRGNLIFGQAPCIDTPSWPSWWKSSPWPISSWICQSGRSSTSKFRARAAVLETGEPPTTKQSPKGRSGEREWLSSNAGNNESAFVTCSSSVRSFSMLVDFLISFDIVRTLFRRLFFSEKKNGILEFPRVLRFRRRFAKWEMLFLLEFFFLARSSIFIGWRN